jgi:hypothetical protein
MSLSSFLRRDRLFLDLTFCERFFILPRGWRDDDWVEEGNSLLYSGVNDITTTSYIISLEAEIFLQKKASDIACRE